MTQNPTDVLQITSTRIAMDIGIIVANMAQSLSFYRDLLGLTVVTELTTSLIGKGHMVQLKYGQSLIKLIALEDGPTEQSLPGLSTRLGYRYMTLLVSDLDAIITRLAQANVSITMPITQLGNGATIAMVADPDGNIVEFVQETVE